MSRELTEYELQLEALVRPLSTAKWHADYRWSGIEKALAEMGHDHGGLELVPDFQRGHVWTEIQQSHFVENCLRGIVPTSGFLLQFNCPTWGEHRAPTDLPNGLQCIDGLQRYTAITRFVRGEINAFGLHANELAGTQFATNRFHMKVAVHQFTKRSDLLKFYIDINSGGTQHSPEEIERVRGLLASSQ